MYDESRNLQKCDTPACRAMPRIALPCHHRTCVPCRRLSGVDMSSKEDSVAPISRMLTMLRNRDMLLCYLRHRMEKIEDARWDVAGTLPEEALEALSPAERQYAREYNDLLSAYQTEYDLDLTRDRKPPTDLYIKVLVLQEVRLLRWRNSSPLALSAWHAPHGRSAPLSAPSRAPPSTCSRATKYSCAAATWSTW